MVNSPLSKSHDEAVAALSARIRRFHEAKVPFRIYHGSTNSTRVSPYQRDNIVDTSQMNRILAIDLEKMLVFAEPNVAMDKLVDATLKLGVLPPVVMEFPGITVGGGYSGTSGESSSFRHGFFDQTVQMVEIILGNGEVVVASADQYSDLFRGAATSLGTLGVVTLVVLQLRRAKSYVSLTYQKVYGMKDAVQKIQVEQTNPELDYVDGMFFSKDEGVLVLGKLTDSVPFGTELTRFARPQDDWFYINAEKRYRHCETWTEVVPIKDYLFRYDRGAFWMGKWTYRYFAIPCNWFTRWLLDRYTHTRMMYHALHQSGLSNRYVIQDVAIPYDQTVEFHSYLDSKFQNYPIWICPLRLGGATGSFPSNFIAEEKTITLPDQPEMMLNFGVWGPGPKNHREFVAWNIAFESKVKELNGQKWLYANTYYVEEEFWSIYDDKSDLRQKYHATYLPTLYDKVKPNHTRQEMWTHQSWWIWIVAVFWSIWPLSGLYGWLHCIVAKEYLLPRKRI